MKIVISTQIRENYGSVAQPNWKFKGGNVYVVPGLTVAQTLKIKEQGIPTLTARLETRNEGFEEYVVDWSIRDDAETVTEPWDTPFELFWKNGRWIANRTVENGEYGWMNRDVLRKTEAYDMLVGGGQANYRVVYTMTNGDMVNGRDVESYLAKAA